jgi:aspirochlorine biosynthesis cytochrome P450 monooxygenase
LQSHAFSEKALSSQQDVIKIHLDAFIDQLKKRALLESTGNKSDNMDQDGVIDIVQWLNFLAFDTIGDLAFGSAFGCLAEGVPSRYIDVIFGLVKFGNWYRAARRFPSPLRELMVIAMIPRNLIQDQRFQHKISIDKVAERMKRDTERPDFSKCFFPRWYLMECVKIKTNI